MNLIVLLLLTQKRPKYLGDSTVHWKGLFRFNTCYKFTCSCVILFSLGWHHKMTTADQINSSIPLSQLSKKLKTSLPAEVNLIDAVYCRCLCRSRSYCMCAMATALAHQALNNRSNIIYWSRLYRNFLFWNVEKQFFYVKNTKFDNGWAV